MSKERLSILLDKGRKFIFGYDKASRDVKLSPSVAKMTKSAYKNK